MTPITSSRSYRKNIVWQRPLFSFFFSLRWMDSNRMKMVVTSVVIYCVLGRTGSVGQILGPSSRVTDMTLMRATGLSDIHIKMTPNLHLDLPSSTCLTYTHPIYNTPPSHPLTSPSASTSNAPHTPSPRPVQTAPSPTSLATASSPHP